MQKVFYPACNRFRHDGKCHRGLECCEADCLVKVSKLLVENPDIRNLDMNPLFIFEKNKGCLVVDAKIERI